MALYFKGIPNSIAFCKEMFLLVIPVCIILLSANPTKWSNKLNKLPGCYSFMQRLRSNTYKIFGNLISRRSHLIVMKVTTTNNFIRSNKRHQKYHTADFSTLRELDASRVDVTLMLGKYSVFNLQWELGNTVKVTLTFYHLLC